MAKSRFKLLLTWSFMACLTACGGLKNYFPDKTKDYQFASEVPPLKLPEDIKAEARIKDTPLVPEQAPHHAVAYSTTQPSPVNAQDKTSKPRYQPVELIEYDGGATRLRMYQPIEKAWRYVGKALSHQSIEITQRSESDYSYTVQYDPDAKKPEDGTLWDELLFLLGHEPSHEKPYHIQLVARNNELTDIVVLDADEQPVRQGGGLALLKLLKTTLNNDLAHRP